jgi:hypothetical protein
MPSPLPRMERWEILIEKTVSAMLDSVWCSGSQRGSSPILPCAKTVACASPPPVLLAAPFEFVLEDTRRDTGRSFEIFVRAHLLLSCRCLDLAWSP